MIALSLLWFEENSVTLAGDAIKGNVKGYSAERQVLDFPWTLDAKVSNGDVAGTYRIQYAVLNNPAFKPVDITGPVTGRLTGEASFCKENALAPGKDWPCYHGPYGLNRGPDPEGVLTDDLATARLVWKSEESLPGMWGKGNEDCWIPPRASRCGRPL